MRLTLKVTRILFLFGCYAAGPPRHVHHSWLLAGLGWFPLAVKPRQVTHPLPPSPLLFVGMGPLSFFLVAAVHVQLRGQLELLSILRC